MAVSSTSLIFKGHIHLEPIKLGVPVSAEVGTEAEPLLAGNEVSAAGYFRGQAERGRQ